MIHRSLGGALVLATLSFGACQTFEIGGGQPAPAATSSAMDGSWASTDGVFVATFERGSFISQFTKTNEMLAKGTYTVSGNIVAMNWISVATKQQRAADCTFVAADVVSCNQQGGGKFQLTRRTNTAMASAAPPPPAPAPAAAAPPPAAAPAAPAVQ
jgi:hypothetical protein